LATPPSGAGRYRFVQERGSDWKLYGDSADPSETNDLTTTHPEVVKDIAAGWQE